jgi:hypothetical protein
MLIVIEWIIVMLFDFSHIFVDLVFKILYLQFIYQVQTSHFIHTILVVHDHVFFKDFILP